MVFNNDRPIYKQIADLCHRRILAGEWAPGERVPSVRELGVELSVNSHTALKAYDLLQSEGVITQRRGLGFFLAEEACEKVKEARRKEFFDEGLPLIFSKMEALGITIGEVVERYHAYSPSPPYNPRC